MTDIASLAQALTAVKQAAEMVKTITAIDAAFQKAELKAKIADLADSLAVARVGILDAQAEIQGLKDEIVRMSSEARSLIIHRDSVYFIRRGDEEAGPYCPRCYEADGRQMPVTMLSGPFAAMGTYGCPQCRAIY